MRIQEFYTNKSKGHHERKKEVGEMGKWTLKWTENKNWTESRKMTENKYELNIKNIKKEVASLLPSNLLNV